MYNAAYNVCWTKTNDSAGHCLFVWLFCCLFVLFFLVITADTTINLFLFSIWSCDAEGVGVTV